MMFHDYELTKPFPIDIGANLEFIAYNNTTKKYKAKTLPAKDRSVNWSITSYRGWSAGAAHWYGNLKVYALSIEIIEAYGDERKYHNPGDVFGTNFFPETMEKCPDLKWTDGFSIDITYERETDEKNPYKKEEWEIEHKGDHSSRFPDFYLLKKRVEEEYLRLFGEQWKLVHNCKEGIEHLRKLQLRDV
jgi:hypothetical protein